MNWISCKDYATQRKKELKKEISSYEKQPTLVVIQIDDDFASSKYIKWKKSDCNEVGIRCIHDHINSNDFSQKDLEKKIIEYDASINIHGIIVQLPIPDKYDVEKLQKCISPEKDVDGFRKDSCYKPCTPKGVMDWIDFNGYNLKGKDVTILGRSKIVGKPLTDMCIDKGATVTCCNSNTSRTVRWRHLQNSQVIFSAIGKPKFLKFTDFVSTFGFKPHLVVDIGINEDENGNLCGDVDTRYFEEEFPNTYVTPVPGGVGLLTRIALLNNVIEANNIIEGR